MDLLIARFEILDKMKINLESTWLLFTWQLKLKQKQAQTKGIYYEAILTKFELR